MLPQKSSPRFAPAQRNSAGKSILEILALALSVAMVLLVSIKIFQRSSHCTPLSGNPGEGCPIVVVDSGHEAIPHPLPSAPASLETVTEFDNPQVNGIPIDHCLNFSANCDKPAADKFCETNGYESAKNFDVGQPGDRSYILGDEKFCYFPPRQEPRCRAFARVVCRKRSV